METVELYPGIKSSRIGFGCASVLGAQNAEKSKEAIFCAMDNGVNHFDMARSYGYGEAEHFVGKQLKSRRQDLVIASKFGIVNTKLSYFLRPLKPIVRSMKSKIKTDTTNINSLNEPRNLNIGRDFFHKRININQSTLVKNLEKSLKSLQTDYLDYYFIHEPFNSIENINDIMNMADELKKNGKIRAFGLASDVNYLPFHQSYLDFFDIIQFNPQVNLDNAVSEVVDSRTSKANILFAPFKSALGNDHKDILGNLKMRFSKSIILCSMFTPAHIIENCNYFNN